MNILKVITSLAQQLSISSAFGKKGDKFKSIEDLQKAIHFIEKKIEMTEFEIALEYEMQPDLFEGDATSGYVNQDR